MPLYIGVDFHPHQQTACWCDLSTGEIKTRTLKHRSRQELTKFYQDMPPSLVGIEATSKATWFENLLFDNHHQLLPGHPAVIRKMALSRHKSDNRDARHIFDLLLRGAFPTLWRRPQESSEILELIKLRHSLVQQRTQSANRLQALGHQAGLPKGALKSLSCQSALQEVDWGANYAAQRDLLLARWQQDSADIQVLELRLQEVARQCARAQLLQTQSGVGYLTALSFLHTVGDVTRFNHPAKEVVAFLGLDPVEESSGSKVKFGAISKAGSSLTRFLLGQAAQTASRYDARLKAKYRQLSKKKHKAVAKTAIARRLAVKLTIMLRDNITAQEFDERGGTVGHARGAQGLQ